MRVRPLVLVWAVALAAPVQAQQAPGSGTFALIPKPTHVAVTGCASSAVPRTVAPDFDPGALDELNERWSALGAGTLRVASAAHAAITVRRDPSLAPQAYRLTVGDGRATIASADAAGAFYGAMTLAQLPVRTGGRWTVPCVRIDDAPALQWRVLSDDVSRGPLPTMRYFRERIRTIAAFKFNGYSPYMEHVFVSPTDPLPAPLDGITPSQLAELARYAARFHVALIPQQQTFAHMHGTLQVERYAPAAEFPHGFLLGPQAPDASAYLARIVSQELAAVPHPPFFHIGSDETATLGLGTTAAYVAQRGGRTQAFAEHVRAMNAAIAPSGARTMIWDDALEQDAAIGPLLPRSVVAVNWHYGAQADFRSFIERIAQAKLDQMVAPGAGNWNEIFPDVRTAIANERGFIEQGQAAHVMGAFETVWHDDGETLYEATWYPVLFAGAAAWQRDGADPAAFAAAFPSAFFGTPDARYAEDVERLGTILQRLEAAPYDRTDALFWSSPFDTAVEARMQNVDLRAVRLDAEAVEEHLLGARPPLHANAAAVMFLAARRYDTLARKYQIAQEVRAMYADALAHAAESDGPALRDLYWSRYWMWELRDRYEDLAPLYAAAWRYESRDGHLASNLERYHLAASQAIENADAIYRATYEGYVRNHTLPPLTSVVR